MTILKAINHRIIKTLKKQLHSRHIKYTEKSTENPDSNNAEKTSGIKIAMDDHCALEIIGDTYRIISSQTNANAYKMLWKRGIFHEKFIAKKKEFV